jgi:uncharacterized membrane protein YphA (DoxX/SURF4 family)
MTIKLIRNIARFLIGLVFIFSGFAKAIDPLGSAYKFTDYFDAFHMGFFTPLSLVLAILLSTAELLIGLNLFLKIRMRESAWALLIFMSFFTLLTLISALTDPVTDCGCFGDALILTNWQTFIKNLIFFIPTIIVFQQRNQFLGKLSDGIEWTITAVLFSGIVLLSVYCLMHLPLIDFRPYKVGTNIAESMKIPEGMPVDDYETVLVYEKNGIRKEFSLNSPEKPWSDSTWKWVETRNVLVKEGYHPPIHDFSLTSESGIDYTQQLLSDTGYSFLIVSYDLSKANPKGMNRVNELVSHALAAGYRVYGMTASIDEEVNHFKTEHKISYEFYTTDEITLKTMIRCNPGVILIKEGIVIGKWQFRDIPDSSLFKQGGLSYTLLKAQHSMNKRLVLIALLLISLAGISLYLIRLDF